MDPPAEAGARALGGVPPPAPPVAPMGATGGGGTGVTWLPLPPLPLPLPMPLPLPPLAAMTASSGATLLPPPLGSPGVTAPDGGPVRFDKGAVAGGSGARGPHAAAAAAVIAAVASSSGAASAARPVAPGSPARDRGAAAIEVAAGDQNDANARLSASRVDWEAAAQPVGTAAVMAEAAAVSVSAVGGRGQNGRACGRVKKRAPLGGRWRQRLCRGGAHGHRLCRR